MFFADGAFFTGAPEAAFQFLAVVTFTRVVFFDDDKIGAFHAFKSCESVFTFFAFAAAADLFFFMSIARVQDGGFGVFTFWTEQGE